MRPVMRNTKDPMGGGYDEEQLPPPLPPTAPAPPTTEGGGAYVPTPEPTTPTPEPPSSPEEPTPLPAPAPPVPTPKPKPQDNSPLAVQGSFAQVGTEQMTPFRTTAFNTNRVIGGGSEMGMSRGKGPIRLGPGAGYAGGSSPFEGASMGLGDLMGGTVGGQGLLERKLLQGR